LTIPRNARWDIRAATRAIRAIKAEHEVEGEEAMTITVSHRAISITEVVVMDEAVDMVLLRDRMATTITRLLPPEVTIDRLEDMRLRHTDIMTLRREMAIINADIARDGIRDSGSRIIRSKDRGRGNLNITISREGTRPITDRDTKIVNIMAVIRSNTSTARDTRTGVTTIGDMAAETRAVTAGVAKRALEPFWTVADCEGTRST